MVKFPAIGFIGGGNMGAAILSGIAAKYGVNVCEKDQKRCQYLKRQFKVGIQDLATLLAENRIIILAVKPQGFDALLAEIRDSLTARHVIISIAAGISTKYIEKRLGNKARVIRTMPNLPAQVEQGMTAICKGKAAVKADVLMASRLFKHVGKTVIVEEKWMDAVTAVSGSGPAYVFLFVESFMKAAKSLGFKDDLSQQLVTQTLRGSLDLLESQKEDAGVLRARVTSKGGTTQAAMEVFQKGAFEKTFKNALKAAAKRAKDLEQ